MVLWERGEWRDINLLPVSPSFWNLWFFKRWCCADPILLQGRASTAGGAV